MALFRLILKFILLPLFLLLAATAAIAAWLLFTPIDETNVKSRIWQSCMIASGARAVLGAGRSPPLRGFSPAQCSCVGDTLVARMGAPVAATGAEAVRGFLQDGLQTWMARGSYSRVKNSPQAQIAEAFVRTSTQLASSCVAN